MQPIRACWAMGRTSRDSTCPANSWGGLPASSSIDGTKEWGTQCHTESSSALGQDSDGRVCILEKGIPVLGQGTDSAVFWPNVQGEEYREFAVPTSREQVHHQGSSNCK